jgi:hypothetical protein
MSAVDLAAAGSDATTTTHAGDKAPSLGGYWQELVTTALLGTDRRPLPTAPVGPLRELADDWSVSGASPSARLLDAVAACSVARRAGVRPGAPAALMQAAADDARPITEPAVTATWRRMMADWPVVDDEWQLLLIASGQRPAPDLLVAALARHRADAVRHARVVQAGGPAAQWLIDQRPHLGCRAKQPAPGSAAEAALAAAVATVPELPISPELVALHGRPAGEVAATLRDAFDSGTVATAHRGVLVNFVARTQPGALAFIATQLDQVNPAQPSIGLAFALADLARLRALVHAQLAHTRLREHPLHPVSPTQEADRT